MKLNKAQELSEQAIYEHTSSTKWQEVKYMKWTTSEMQDVIAKALVKNLSLSRVVKSLPSKDVEFIYSLLPEWTKEAPKGLDPTMYGTLTYEGDKEIVDKLKEILK